jgi:ABC-type uncharacterized transport system ATPase subunit
VDLPSVNDLASWGDDVKKQVWIKSISLQGSVARVYVSDVETAKRELLSSILRSGLIVTRYEVLRPSLEDVFLQLIGREDVEK